MPSSSIEEEDHRPPNEISYFPSWAPSSLSKINSAENKTAGEKDDTEQDYNDKKEKDFLTRYNDLLDTNPVATKAITSAFISGLGAAIGTYLSNSGKNKKTSFRRGNKNAIDGNVGFVNWLDVFVFALHGGLIGGPLGHYWFDWLEKQKFSTVKSMLIDQLAVQPPLLIFMFLFLDTTKAAIKEIRPSMNRTLSTVGPTIVNSWKFWPLAVWCTFRYLKKKHYTVALNLCSLAWTMYLNKGK